MDRHEHARILRNWKAERDSAALYGALASIERNPRLVRVFSKLADSEREHSAYWESRLREQGQSVPKFRPSMRTRALIQLARRFGVALIVPSIASSELADRDRYSTQEDASTAGLTEGERGHAAVMRRVAAYGDGIDELDAMATAGGGDVGNKLRAAVLGANDGLSSNFSLLMGVAGGGVATSTIILTGVAGLVAGACSMALGEWLSVTNAREMVASQVDSGQALRAESWKREQLALIYEAGGLSEVDAQRAAERVIARDPDALRALIGEERAIAVMGTAGNNPLSAASYSFVLFATGACIPLLPFLFATRTSALIASAALSLLALFAIGLLTSFFNRRSPLFSGLRQVGIGAAAAAVTYAIGRGAAALMG
jgi:VIT1/CCC1 family predicted Fe2+/Mn2+ transporter